mgnify:CR=1 FL=1
MHTKSESISFLTLLIVIKNLPVNFIGRLWKRFRSFLFQKELPNSVVIGVDLDRSFDDRAKNNVSLVACDCLFLPFIDAIFDYCYYYHVLEHIINSEKALDEMVSPFYEEELYKLLNNRFRVVKEVSMEYAL